MRVEEFDTLLQETREVLHRAYASDQFWSWLDYMCNEARHHRKRLAYTMTLVEQMPGRLLDVGSNMVFACMFSRRRSGPTTLINHGTGGSIELRFLTDVFPIELIDIQRDRFPFADETFDSVLFLEVLEHMSIDPMRTMSEINRVNRTGGALLLTTPNVISYRSIAEAIAGHHPHLSGQYLKIDSTDRHNREYTPAEIDEIVRSSGYTVEWAATPSVYSSESEFAALAAMLSEKDLSKTLRGDTVAIRGRKSGPVVTRHPAFLYF